MSRWLIPAILIVLAVLLALLLWFCPNGVEKRPPTLLTTSAGVVTTEFQLHESVLLDAVGLEPRMGYNIRVRRDDGETIVALRLSTDGEGRIPQTVIWYDVGTKPCPTPRGEPLTEFDGALFDVTDHAAAGRHYTVSVGRNEEIVREMTFSVTRAGNRPIVYAANRSGCAKSGFLIGEEDIWVVGKNFPEGSLVRAWAVPANSTWEEGMQLEDQTRRFGGRLPPIFELGEFESDFMRLLWPRGLISLGSYDIVAEVVSYDFGHYRANAAADVQGVVAHTTYSGFVVQRRPGVAEPLEVDIAGAVTSPYTFRNTFLTTENVYVGVDPCLQSGLVGQTADIYIVADKTDAQWTTDTNLTDVTGVVETITVGGICGNCWKTLAWTAPLVVGEYDVVLDFNSDGVYTAGTDLIDSLDPVGFIVAEVRVDTISFNYGGSGAITIRDNVNHANIAAPEYLSANHIVSASAWTMGGSHSVQTQFRAVPGVNTARIWAEGGLGGLNSSSSPVTVAFAGGTGQAIFSVNSPPTSINKHTFSWDWKYNDVNGSGSATEEMGETGEHLLYTVYSSPQPPMTMPWLQVLDYATDWASGETTQAGLVAALVDGIYNSGMVYNGWQHHTRPDKTTFYLNEVFTELSTPGVTVYMDCRDCANLFHVLTNALGFSEQYLVIPGFFSYDPMLPMGVTFTGSSSCKSGGWNFHQVGWCGSHVADASTKLNCTSSSSSLLTAVCDITATDYINALTPTAGITTGATGVCSPQE